MTVIGSGGTRILQKLKSSNHLSIESMSFTFETLYNVHVKKNEKCQGLSKKNVHIKCATKKYVRLSKKGLG